MKQYLELLKEVYEHGEDRGDRTGTGTRSLFGKQLKFDLNKGFPILTTKKIHWKSVAHELLWFISGDTNIKYLNDNGVTIWDEWAREDGELGPVYGAQWRKWRGNNVDIDQLGDAVWQIKNNPEGRRIIVNAWNVDAIRDMALPPCHLLFQFYVSNPGTPQARLSCQMYQRSADLFLGVPFNIASYALLTELIAASCGIGVGKLTICFGDVHIYKNHFEQVETQLKRKPLPLPDFCITDGIPDFDRWLFGDFCLDSYIHHPAIKAKVSV